MRKEALKVSEEEAIEILKKNFPNNKSIELQDVVNVAIKVLQAKINGDKKWMREAGCNWIE